MHKLIEKYGLRIEEIILVLLIVMGIIDFLDIIPAEVSYVKKILEWTAFAYILYKADLTNIFFGKSHKTLDVMLIIAYFMLFIKEFVGAVMSDIKGATLLKEFYTAVLINASTIEKTGFYIGAIMLILIAIIYATKQEIRKPSVMHVIHEEGQPPKNIFKLTVRFVAILLVLVLFFIIIFNLVMEWLTIAVDAPLLVAGVFFYIFHARRFSTETLVYKMAEIGEKFYKKFIEMFKYKNKIFMGIAGMLVLHIITDIGNFMIPFLTGLYNPLYFEHLGMETHQTILSLFKESIIGATQQEIVGLSLVYILNISAIIFIMVMPAYFWYEHYSEKRIGIKQHWIALFAMAAVILLMKSIFSFGQITQKNLIGVDITTHATSMTGLWDVLKIAAVVGIIVFILSFMIKKLLELMLMLSVLGFFGYYIYLFFMNTASYYIETIIMLGATPHKFIAAFMFLFLISTIIFYIGGFIIFLAETARSYFRF